MKKKKLIIAIDFDDVIVLTGNRQVEYYNETYRQSVHPRHFYSTATTETWGTDDDQLVIDRIAKHTMSEEFAQTPPTEESIQAIHHLAQYHELHIVTGRPQSIEGATLATIDKYFKGCFKTVEHTNMYTPSTLDLVRRAKGDVCKDLQVDIFIDDHVGHCRSVQEAGISEIIVFGDYDWNRHESLGPGMIRCVDWSAVLKEVERVSDAGF